MTELPQRSARIPDETQADIVRLAIRQVSQAEIARRLKIHRQTVRRVLKRTSAVLAIERDVEKDRAEAITVYREVQRAAWEAIEAGKRAAELLAEVRQSQQRIDNLLGLAVTAPDDPALLLEQFKRTVVAVIQAEAPELAPRLAQRLLEARDGRSD
jgi:DNA-directed RNA polymerase sigma subunit (sigma70/sigma32)